MSIQGLFEIKATDLGGRIGKLKTKTSEIETPALLPVIHPVRQLVPCERIKAMGYQAVMTNAYTTLRRLNERAHEGIHKLIGFEGSIMTDSGGYQVLEFGDVEVSPEEMARFEEKIGSDIAVVLDKPTGLGVGRDYSRRTVQETLRAGRLTEKAVTRNDIIWTIPIQGGEYPDIVEKSAKASAKMDYAGCYALGSPVEMMEEYNFASLVRIIAAAKKNLPKNRPFHLFGAGHPLVLPLAIALGCDTFDSASYILYAKQDRFISSGGTIRLEKLEYLGCSCEVCSSLNVRELKAMRKEDRTVAIASHNLFVLRQKVEETKQAIWDGRLWEYVKANSLNHPRALEGFKVAISLCSTRLFEEGTPSFKEKGLFLFDSADLGRPEVRRYKEKVKQLDFRRKDTLLILPETATKPFNRSKLYQEVSKIILENDPLARVLVTFACPNFGLVPAEISDIYPLSQAMSAGGEFPVSDPLLSDVTKKWKVIHALVAKHNIESNWVRSAISFSLAHKRKNSTRVLFSTSYGAFKRRTYSLLHRSRKGTLGVN